MTTGETACATPDYRPRVTVYNQRAVSSRWADASQLRDAVASAGKRNGTYVLGDGGWAPVAVSPVVAWPSEPVHSGCDGHCCRPTDTTPGRAT